MLGTNIVQFSGFVFPFILSKYPCRPSINTSFECSYNGRLFPCTTWLLLGFLWLFYLSVPIHYYRPQRSCGKVMFLHVSVILSHRRGGLAGRYAPGQTPPGRQTPPLAETPPQGRPLQRTVRILLECILVSVIPFFHLSVYCGIGTCNMLVHTEAL